MATLQTREELIAVRSRAERVAAFCLPSLGDMLFVCVLLGVVFGLQGRTLGIDGDIGWSLRIGLQTLSSGLPRHEFLISTTYGQPVVYWEWLAQVIYALAYRLAGLNGVVAVAGAIVAGTSIGLYAAIRRRHIPLLAALALTLAGIALTSITWTARAQLFSLPLTLWWSENLWRYWHDGRPRRLWYCLPVTALWANLHGGFLGGLILLATAAGVAWLFPHQRAHANPRHLTLALAGALLATLLTPWGFALPAHILAYLRSPLISRYTQEYQSPDFHSLAGQFFLALVFLLIAVWLYMAVRSSPVDASNVGRETKRSSAADQPEKQSSPHFHPAESRMWSPLAFAHAAIWTTLAFVSVRFVPLWALIVLPILAESVHTVSRAMPSSMPNGVDPSLKDAHSAYRPVRERAHQWSAWSTSLHALSQRLEVVDRQVGRGVWSAIAILFVLVTLASGGRLPGGASILAAHFDPAVFPVQAARRLRVQGLPPGRGFTTYEWGGYLDFALPGYHVFIDSRSDAYSQRLLDDYATLSGLGPGWHDLLRQYQIRWALLPADAPLAQVLALAPGWRCASADDAGVAVLCVLGGP